MCIISSILEETASQFQIRSRLRRCAFGTPAAAGSALGAFGAGASPRRLSRRRRTLRGARLRQLPEVKTAGSARAHTLRRRPRLRGPRRSPGLAPPAFVQWWRLGVRQSLPPTGAPPSSARLFRAWRRKSPCLAGRSACRGSRFLRAPRLVSGSSPPGEAAGGTARGEVCSHRRRLVGSVPLCSPLTGWAAVHAAFGFAPLGSKGKPPAGGTRYARRCGAGGADDIGAVAPIYDISPPPPPSGGTVLKELSIEYKG